MPENDHDSWFSKHRLGHGDTMGKYWTIVVKILKACGHVEI